MRGDELHPALISHLSKYKSLMPSLALLFELADRASSEGFDGSSLMASSNFVSLQHAKQAAEFCDYLESHALRVYSCVVTPQLRSAQELADKIKKRKMGTDGFFSCRDVYLKGWTGLDTPEAVRQAVDVLRDAGSGCPLRAGAFRRASAEQVRSESGGVVMSAAPHDPAKVGRWLEWKPKRQMLVDSPDRGPTEPSKPGSGGFDGGQSSTSPEIQAVPPVDEPRAIKPAPNTGVVATDTVPASSANGKHGL